MQLTIDRYEVKRLIGQGAMGRIYLAADPKLGRDVAIKMMSTQTADHTIRDRFRLEARAIATLKHPNIVELYDYSGETAHDLFLVMEYVPGRTLHDLVLERGHMPEVVALCVMHEVVLALEHAHQNKVVHRDVKPENVLLHQGRVVLTDFGVVKQVAAEGAGRKERSATQSIGTPGYMAPEQFSADPVSPQTDLFAVGAMLYSLTTGRLPFPGDNVGEVAERVLKGAFEDPRTFSPLLSEGFNALVARCLRVRPRDRFADASTLREELLDVLRAHGVTEVRKELLDYERNPANYAIDQRERGLDVLIRDLKLAVKDRDEPRVQAIVQRMQTLAPLSNRVRSITGLTWRKGSLPRLSGELRASRRHLRNGSWFTAGLVVGAFLALTLLAMGHIPTGLMHWFERFAEWTGLGY